MVVIDSSPKVVSGSPKGFDTSYWEEHRTAANNVIKGFFLMQQGVKYADLPSQNRQYISLKPHPGIDPGLFMIGPNVIIFGDLPDPGFPNS
jgi:uncharacterized membrane protein